VTSDDAQEDTDVLDQSRLMHLRSGKSREARVLGLDDRFGAVALRRGDRPLGEVDRARHDGATPTWTFRNRAGAAPWLTCACWPGCPLPQLVRPYSTQVSGPPTASSEPQKTGVTPVYVASRSIRPRLPCLISQATCVPNWKFRRLSSIDQDLFVSR